MSLVDQPFPGRSSSHSSPPAVVERTYIDSARSCQDTYDDAIFDDFYDAEEQDMMDATQDKPSAGIEAPPLPQKNALRASRLLDNLGLKLGGSLEPREEGQATPHDVYLSSEEDASSSADDFSDYEYDSSSEGCFSPTRHSHEDTARIVSVVFAGKPSIIELSLSRRSGSPNSSDSRRQSCVDSISNGSSPGRRPSTSAGSMLSFTQTQRRSTMLSTLLSNKQKPSFLKIDPYANGSTYSLELPSASPEEPRQPKTPTTLLKGVSRTFSLVRKRSRPILNNFAATPSRDNLASPISPSKLDQVTVAPQPETVAAVEPKQTVQSPVTYNDIIQAAKKNAKAAPALSPVAAPQSPLSPSSPNASKKGFLSGLAARRRSLKMINGKIM